MLLICSSPVLFLNELLRHLSLSKMDVNVASISSIIWLFPLIPIVLIRLGENGNAVHYVSLWLMGASLSLAYLMMVHKRALKSALSTRSRHNSLSQLFDSSNSGNSYFTIGLILPISALLMQISVTYKAGEELYGLIAANALAWIPISVLASAAPVLISQIPVVRERWKGLYPNVLLISLCLVTSGVWALVILVGDRFLFPQLLGDAYGSVKQLIPFSILLMWSFLTMSFMLSTFFLVGRHTAAKKAGLALGLFRVIAIILILILNTESVYVFVMIDALTQFLTIAGMVVYVIFNRDRTNKIDEASKA